MSPASATLATANSASNLPPLPTPTRTTAFASRVWLLVGLTGSEPGLLEMADGRLAFSTGNETLFNVPLDAVTGIKFPWYYFGGGVKFTVDGKKYRLSFVRPNNAADIPARLLARTGTPAGAALALLTVGQKIQDIGFGRQAGKIWRAALESGPTKSGETAK